MQPTSPNTLCASCSQLSSAVEIEPPHVLLRLHAVRPPLEFEGTLEREYHCIECAAVWIRQTDCSGTDIALELKS